MVPLKFHFGWRSKWLRFGQLNGAMRTHAGPEFLPEDLPSFVAVDLPFFVGAGARTSVGGFGMTAISNSQSARNGLRTLNSNCFNSYNDFSTVTRFSGAVVSTCTMQNVSIASGLMISH